MNADDKNVELFSKFSSKRTIFYGIESGDMRAKNLELKPDGASFNVYGTRFNINFGGRFNVLNCLAALSVAAMYGTDLPSTKPVLEGIKNIPGRMEFIQKEPFSVVVDYAHTPESLEQVYQTLGNPKSQILNPKQIPNSKIQNSKHRLICVLGAAGGGRDKWKRPEFGRIAGEYCDEIILTDEDPYDENPEEIINQISSGFSKIPNSKFQIPNSFHKILDRKEAIKTALIFAKQDDVVVITGKGSEISMAVAGGKKIPWSDKEIVREFLR